MAGVYNNEYARVNASVMKSLCDDDDKLWNTLLKDRMPKQKFKFVTFEVRFAMPNVSISTKPEPKKDVDMPDKSKYIETLELLQALYKTVLHVTYHPA